MSDNFWELLWIFVLGMWLYWFLTVHNTDEQYNWPGSREQKN